MTLRGWLWRDGSPWVFFLELLVIVLHLLFFAGLARKALLPPPPTPEIRLLSEATTAQIERRDHFRLNLLCMGLDSVEGSHRTDTILLLGIDFSTRGIHILSIPRDTRVVIDGHQRKINEVYSRHGVDVLQTLIEDLLEIRINRYIKVDFQGFVKIIDMIGGIDLFIERPMHYDDNWGKLHIHFDPGQHHLSGQKALEYVRFRADANADLGRVKRQQRFIAAVLEKVMAPSFLLKIPDLLHEAFTYIDTNLTLPETIELAMGMRGKGFTTQSESLPGEARYIDKISFYVPFKEQATALGTKYYSSLTSFELNAPFQASATVVTPFSGSGTVSSATVATVATLTSAASAAAFPATGASTTASAACHPVSGVAASISAQATGGTAVTASDASFAGRSSVVASPASSAVVATVPVPASAAVTASVSATATETFIASATNISSFSTAASLASTVIFPASFAAVASPTKMVATATTPGSFSAATPASGSVTP